MLRAPDPWLVLGGPPRENPAAAAVVKQCRDHLQMTDKGFLWMERVMKARRWRFLASCRRDDYPDSVVTLLYGVTPAGIGARGPALVFTGGRVMGISRGAVVARGDWEDMMSPEVPP